MKLCLGCMGKVRDYSTPCPHCGFDMRTYRQEAYYLKPGTIIAGKYVVGKALRYNGFVITYIGWDIANSRKASIEEYMASDFATRAEGDKEVTIYSGDAAGEYAKGLSLFLQEGKAMQKLQGVPGIATVYACCAENATGYRMMEYLTGKRLHEALPSGKRLTYAQAEKIMEPLLQSLHALHQAGVMHYDIAPDNILLTADGKVKLVDFGAARYATSARSRSLAVLVKQGYTPEEQYRSQGKKGSWSDVYAAAAVFYRMLTGIVPEESIERAMQDNLKEPSKCGADISKSVENALLNALNVYAADRTKTIRQFSQELKSDHVKRVQPSQKDSEKGGNAKKLVLVGLAALTIALGAAVATYTRSVSLSREAAGTYMLSPTELNEFMPDGEEAVRERLAKLGFEEGDIEFIYEYSADNEADMVFETIPAGQEQLTDELLKKGAAVYIGSREYVSVTEDGLKNLETKKIEKAESILRNKYGFTNIAQRENEDYDDGTAGTVYQVDGNFTEKTSCGEPITIICARGTRESYEKTVPDLIGQDYGQYVQKKEIQPVRVDVFGPGWGSFTDGMVVKTSKKAGETIVTGGPDGEEFVCYVWNSRPDLASLTEGNVKAELAKVGITAQQGEGKYSPTVAKGSLIFDSDKLVEGQKAAVVYHKSLGPEPGTGSGNNPTSGTSSGTRGSGTPQGSGTRGSGTPQGSGTSSGTGSQSGTSAKPSKEDSGKEPEAFIKTEDEKEPEAFVGSEEHDKD